MLGLGSSIVHGSLGGYVLIDTYTSDFTGGAGDDSSTWSAYSNEGDAPTFTTNAGATVSGPMSNDCLKVEFNSNQSTASGIQSVLDSRTWENNDKLVYSYLIYIAGDWEAANEVEVWFNQTWGGNVVRANDQLTSMTSGTMGSGSTSNLQWASPRIPQDTVVGVNGVAYIQGTASSYGSNFQLYNSQATSEPQDGATIYIKDFEIKTYRRFG